MIAREDDALLALGCADFHFQSCRRRFIVCIDNTCLSDMADAQKPAGAPKEADKAPEKMEVEVSLDTVRPCFRHFYFFHCCKCISI